MGIELREMTIDDYRAVYAVWKVSEGLGLSDADSKEGIKRFLERNPGLSYIAVEGDQVVGAALCGHDGRRGYIHHLSVVNSHRKRGIGRSLVSRCVFALMQIGISKCHLFVFDENQDAIEFWHKVGWTQRVELMMMSQHFDN
ncbi:MAG: GNAT family N-acetyltransferase [Anaerolineales bacterium]|nr:GNAT family N-acetyltransferase [Anaerolineales bacterium]